MTSPDDSPIDSVRAAGWRSGPGLSGLQSMRAAASLNLDAARGRYRPDQQADDDTAGPTALGVRRRLRALTARSWSPQAIADQTGVPAPLISSLLGGNPRNLSPGQRQAIADAYDKIWDREPPAGTRDQRGACESARSRAAGRGWAPPQAWDDAQIDQPDGRPSPDWCCPSLKCPMKAAFRAPMWGCLKAPQPGCCGALVVGVPLVVGEVPVSGVGVFGDGGPGGLLVDDDFAGREGGDEGLDGEVVDGTWVAARCGVDE
jgi:hypothetical protein